VPLVVKKADTNTAWMQGYGKDRHLKAHQEYVVCMNHGRCKCKLTFKGMVAVVEEILQVV
jgi:hypothetical protein